MKKKNVLAPMLALYTSEVLSPVNNKKIPETAAIAKLVFAQIDEHFWRNRFFIEYFTVLKKVAVIIVFFSLIDLTLINYD